METRTALGLWSRGRAFGLLGSTVLFAHFVFPPVADLAGRACSGSLICPSKVERGTYTVFAVMTVISLLAGVLISREIDRQGPAQSLFAAAIFGWQLLFFGGILWLTEHVAFY